MFAGKFSLPANVIIRSTLFVSLCCLLLVASLAGFAFSSSTNVCPGQAKLFIIGRSMQTYDLDGTQWNFPLLPTGFGAGARTARLVEFSINGYDILHLVPEAQRTLPVLRLDNEIDLGSFRKWNDYRRRAATLRVRDDKGKSFSAVEEREFKGMTGKIREIGDRRREFEPTELVIAVSDLPFKVAADDHYRVRVAVERGQQQAVCEWEIIIVDVEPLALNPNWTPADLHIHSTFGDPSGRNTPAQLAAFLAGKGYTIGYVTDEPAGWNMTASTVPVTMGSSGWHGIGAPRATWEHYRNTVRSA